jgi:hypothetical protein
MKTAEKVNEIEIFEYRLRDRLFRLAWLGCLISLYLLLILPLVLLGLYRAVSGQTILAGIGGPSDLGTSLVFIILPPLMILGGYLFNLAYPAVHIQENGFRIKRLFYTSPWFEWQQIHNVKKLSWSSKRREVTAVTIKGLGGGCLSIVGVFHLKGDKEGFGITSHIENYKELLEWFKQKRPDLF